MFIQHTAFITFRIAIDVLIPKQIALILLIANSIFVNIFEIILHLENCLFIFNLVKFVVK